MSRKIEVYDTTLRDGMQGRDISFSLQDKLEIARLLDELGVHFIEGGYPDSNPKDMEFFKETPSLELENAQIAVFGRTCLKGISPSKDKGLHHLSKAKVEIVALFGKSWDRQVETVLETDLDENLRMIRETCAFFRDKERRVFFDAEHFFDGFKGNPEYAVLTLEAAIKGGAERLILCDTRGGTLHWEIGGIVKQIKQEIDVPLGIHAHNDSGLAVANSLEALREGAIQVQGTINGYGERGGNADLVAVLADIRHKTDWSCVKMHQIAQLTRISRAVADIANQNYDYKQPYVGRDAFAHKAGYHVAGVVKRPESYEHVRPESVGNVRSVAGSELSGKANVRVKAKEFGIELTREQEKDVLAKIKELERGGFQFDGADGSLELLMLRSQEKYCAPFEIECYNFNVNRGKKTRGKKKNGLPDKAFVKVRVGDRYHTKRAMSDKGGIHAFDIALRSALANTYFVLDKVKLIDYKARTIDSGGKGTESTMRVLTVFTDGEEIWTTVGVHPDMYDASEQALSDGLELAILREPKQREQRNFLSAFAGIFAKRTG